MREEIEDCLGLVCQNCHSLWTMRQVRGVVKDRQGKHYWLWVTKSLFGHFRVSLSAWPSLFLSHRTSAGWIALGSARGSTSWMIYDVQVSKPRWKQRGLGTLLVRAAIALAQRQGAQELRGKVTSEDAQTHPFLPAWYARLGFVVTPDPEAESATFWMNLAQER